MTLRYRPVYRVLYRPNLLLGCERKPLLTVLVAVGTVGIPAANVVGAVAAGLILFAGLYVLRWTVKTDPMMIEVYKRAVRCERYYPARSSPYRRL